MAPPSDLEKWNAVGPVRTIHRENASWDQGRGDWGEPWRDEADFNPDGRLMEERSFNSDASIVHTSWTYDGSGRVVEVRRWCDKWSSRTKCLYNSQGHPLRTIDVAPDGTERVAETWGIDELGRRTRVQFLPPVQTLPVSKYDHEEAALGTGYGIPNAVTATSVYDVEDRIIEVRYHDASHVLVFTVTLTRDGDGHVVLDEERFGGQFNLGKEFDDRLARASEEDRRKFSELIAAALDDGRFSSTTYERDAKGRVLTRVVRMGTMDETRSALAYDASGNIVERVEYAQGASLGLDEAGRIARREDAPTERHFRFDYLYDDRGNWIERVGSLQETGTMQHYEIERRTFTYYTA
ncbi:MAG TPA: hypothetical protein VJ260_04810 [Vicinamibacterales bacterium]|nr:hypothetical protein [Vicinamibacterales bacterium]